MATIIMTLRVRREDAPDVLEVVSGLGCQARQIEEPDTSTSLVIGESTVIDDSAQAAEQDLVERIETTLRRRNITFDGIGHSFHRSSLTTSRFTVRPLGAGEDADEPLVIYAEDRAEFIERLNAIRTLFRDEPWPSADLAGYEVTVEGLAAGDPDVQRPPFSLDPPICLMSGGSLGFERGRDERTGGSVPASHRSLPHFACQGLLHDPGLGPSSKGGLIRPALSGVAPTPIARAVRTPSPTARLSADAGTASWPGERSGPVCR